MMDELRAWSRFSESLHSLRTSDKGDVILQSGDSVFYAHRLVLEASSAYFAAMFNSGLEEAKTGKIVFKEIGPSTLECILDFIYKKKVDKISGEDEVRHVLQAAHLLTLEDLFQYCCEMLVEQMTIHSFFEIFELVNCYEVDMTTLTVLNFWMANARELVRTDEFLLLSFDKVNDLLDVLKSHLVSLDAALFGILRWLQHDVNDRRQYSESLLQQIDVNLVTKDCIKSLLKNKELVTSSQEVTSAMKEISLNVFITDGYHAVQYPRIVSDTICAETKLIFFCRHRNVEVFQPDQNCNVVKRMEYCGCFQQFNLSSREWLPYKKINLSVHQSICQHKQSVFIASGRGVHNILYDVENGTMQGLERNEFLCRDDAGMCTFNDYIYLIGGKVNYSLITQVHCLNPRLGKWHEVIPLQMPVSTPFVLTSSNYIFVISVLIKRSEVVIQYNAMPETTFWEITYIDNRGINLFPYNFFIFRNKLRALYLVNDETVYLTLDDKTNKMELKRFPGHPAEVTRVARACHSLYSNEIQACLTKSGDWMGIPNYSWNPENGEWLELCPVTGKYELPYVSGSIEYVV